MTGRQLLIGLGDCPLHEKYAKRRVGEAYCLGLCGLERSKMVDWHNYDFCNIKRAPSRMSRPIT